MLAARRALACPAGSQQRQVPGRIGRAGGVHGSAGGG
jgi:hypothetical protein